MTTSRAQQFFGELVAQASPFDFIKQIVKSGSYEECEWLDFKEAAFIDKDTRTEKERDSVVKGIWSENLGAFANTGGGVLIWGVKTSGRAPIAESLAGDAPKLAQRLREIQNDAVDPPVTGVEVSSFVGADGSSGGFVVCYIPQSRLAPHRSVWAEREFYFRVGDSNRQIPTMILRRMFYPQTIPYVVPVVSASLGRAGSDQQPQFHIEMTVDLHNKGIASAEQICIETVGPYEAHVRPDIWARRHQHQNIFDCKCTVHPQQTIRFCDNLASKYPLTMMPPDNELLKVSFKIFAKHAAASNSVVEFKYGELRIANGQKVVREGVDSGFLAWSP